MLSERPMDWTHRLFNRARSSRSQTLTDNQTYSVRHCKIIITRKKRNEILLDLSGPATSRIQKRLSILAKYGTCDWGRTLFAVERTVIAVPRFHEHTTNNPGLNDSQSLTSPSHRKSETLSANDRKLRGALAARSFDVLGLARPSSTL